MHPSPVAHLPIPAKYAHKALVLPHLRKAPSYDQLGFADFLQRHGLSEELILSSDWSKISEAIRAHGGLGSPATNSRTDVREYVESLLQEWLWFGVLHDFEMACGLPLPHDQLTKDLNGTGEPCIDTRWLLSYTKNVTRYQLWANQTGATQYSPENIAQCVGFPAKVKSIALRQAGWQALDRPEYDDLADFVGVPRTEEDWEGPFWIIGVTEENNVELKSVHGDKVVVIPTAVIPLLDRNTFIQHMTSDANPITIFCALGWHPESSHKQVAGAIEKASIFCRAVTRQSEPVISTVTLISLKILYESLALVYDLLFNEEVPRSFDTFMPYFIEEMRLQGWCPLRTGKILKAQSTTMSYIFSLMASNDDRVHLNCDWSACEHRSVTLEQTRTSHDASTCDADCPYVTIDDVSLIEIMKSGGIPAISLRRHSDEHVEYTVCNAIGNPMVAISHVWSHGLANQKDNSLPRCQMFKLFSRIEKVAPGKSASLWIDSLCVPRDEEYRTKAIANMNTIYSTAIAVLVIDKHLEQVGDHILEQRLQLLSSEWQRRLWTLQEGRLGSDVWIQFKEEPVAIAQLCEKYLQVPFEKTSPFFYASLYTESGREVDWHFKKHKDSIQRLLDLTQDVSWRSVTVSTDEPICLGILLGLSFETHKPTMEDVYTNLPAVPRQLPFVKAEKLLRLGLRWAPSSLLNQGGKIFDYPKARDISYLCSNGLIMQNDFIRLLDNIDFGDDSRDQYYIEDGFYLNIEGSRRVLIDVPRDKTTNSPFVSKLSRLDAILLEKHWGRTLQDNHSMGLLVQFLDSRHPEFLEAAPKADKQGLKELKQRAREFGKRIQCYKTLGWVRVTIEHDQTLTYINNLWKYTRGLLTIKAEVEEDGFVLLD